MEKATGDYTKDRLTKAYHDLNQIEVLLGQAAELFNELPREVQDEIYKYHNDHATLNHCLRWGPQAAEEIRKDWHTVVSEIPCAGFEPTPKKAPRGKEKFHNAGGDCYVMERSKRVPTTALIFRPCNLLTPYIVAIGHKPGATSWEQGKYYGKLANALQELESWDATGEAAEQELKPCPFCGGDAEIEKVKDDDGDSCFQVSCTKCYVSTTEFYSYPDQPEGQVLAVKEWNQRSKNEREAVKLYSGEVGGNG